MIGTHDQQGAARAWPRGVPAPELVRSLRAALRGKRPNVPRRRRPAPACVGQLTHGSRRECAAVLTRAHEQLLARADVPKAAQCAIWLGMSLLNAMELV